MADLWATKNGQKMRFSEISWKLLGENKHGWVPMPDHVVFNVANIQKPQTGEKQKTVQKVENVVSKKQNLQPVENEILKVSDSEIQELNLVPSEMNEDFLREAEFLKKGDIKDFFDKNNVEYKNNFTPKQFIETLGKHLNFNAEALKKYFN